MVSKSESRPGRWKCPWCPRSQDWDDMLAHAWRLHGKDVRQVLEAGPELVSGRARRRVRRPQAGQVGLWGDDGGQEVDL